MSTFNPVPEDRLISFSLGPYLLCVNASEVVASIALPVIARMPLTPSYALGAFIFENEVAAAVDLRQKFGFQGRTPGNAPLIISRGSQNPYIAIQVDEVFAAVDGAGLNWRAVKAQPQSPPFYMECDYQGQRLLFTAVEPLFLSGQGAQPQPAAPSTPKVVPLPSVEPAVVPPPAPAVAARNNVLPFQVKYASIGAALPPPVQEQQPSTVAMPPRSARPVSVGDSESFLRGRFLVSRYWLLAAVASLLLTLLLVLGQMDGPVDELVAQNAAVPQAEKQTLVIDTPALRIEVHAPGSAPAHADVEHQVVRGDTLWVIAQRYLGDPFQFPQLAQINDIQNPNLIYPGQVVRIYLKRLP